MSPNSNYDIENWDTERNEVLDVGKVLGGMLEDKSDTLHHSCPLWQKYINTLCGQSCDIWISEKCGWLYFKKCDQNC